MNLVGGTYELPGTFTFGGKSLGTGVAVFFSHLPFECSFHGVAQLGQPWKAAERTHLMLHPLDKQMLRPKGGVPMQSGFGYSIAGTRVGLCLTGEVGGGPADAEYSQWPISAFELQSRYSAAGLAVSVSGTTMQGVLRFRDDEQSLPRVAFQVDFTISREHLQRFFEISDEHWPHFQSLWDQSA